MSRRSRKLVRYGAPGACFACGVALLIAGGSAAVAWILIVTSLVSVARCANAGVAGTPSDRLCEQRANASDPRVGQDRRHLAESRRRSSRPR